MPPDAAEPPGHPPGAAARGSTRHGGALGAAAMLVAVEGLVLLVFAVYYALELALGRAAEPGLAGSVLALCIIGGAGLLMVARAVRNGRRWSRSPALLTQLLLVPVALSMARSERWYAGLVLLACAGTGLVLLLAPAGGGRLSD